VAILVLIPLIQRLGRSASTGKEEG
jgi:hypothetical protein